MNKTANNSLNRIDELGARWEARRQGYIRQYGPQVMDDREFIKATRDMYRTILKEQPYNTLNFDEKISYRIMRGQRRHLNRHLYPNPVVRAIRNVLVAAFRLLRGIGRLVGRILNRMLAVLTGTNGIQVGQARRRQPNRTLIRPSIQSSLSPSADTHLTRQRNGQAKEYPVVERNNTLQPNKVDEVVPRHFQKPRVVSMNTPTNGQRI